MESKILQLKKNIQVVWTNCNGKTFYLKHIFAMPMYNIPYSLFGSLLAATNVADTLPGLHTKKHNKTYNLNTSLNV